MKRSEVFNRKYPRPLDRDAYSIYESFLGFQTEVAENWKTEVMRGHLPQRDYKDIAHLRTRVGVNGDLILTLKPFIGFDVQERIKLYLDFFYLYDEINKAIDSLLNPYWMMRERELVMDEYAKIGPNSKDYVPFRKRWANKNKVRLHQLIMTLKIMVALMKFDNLNAEDFYRFANVIEDDTGDFVESMDALVRDVKINGANFSDAISIEFTLGQAHFYEYPDSDLVQAHWNYSRKHIERMMVDIRIKMIDGGFNPERDLVALDGVLVTADSVPLSTEAIGKE